MSSSISSSISSIRSNISSISSDNDDDKFFDGDNDVNAQELKAFCVRLRRNEIIDCESFDLHLKDDRHAFALCNALMKNTSLRQLKFALWESNMHQAGMEALEKGIRNSSVESLSLESLVRGYDGPKRRRDTGTMMSYIYPTSIIRNLRELNIHCDLVWELRQICDGLLNNQRLEKLSLYVRWLSWKGALMLFDSIETCRLVHISLKHAHQDFYRILFMRGILTTLPSLRHLSIDNGGFDDHSYMQYGPYTGAHSLEAISQLETLTLVNCRLDVVAQEWLMESLNRMPKLEELSVRGHGMDVAGTQQLLKMAASLPSLKKLSLSCDDVTRRSYRGMFQLLEDDYNHGLQLPQPDDYDGNDFPLRLQNSCAAMLINNLKNGLVLQELNVICQGIQLAGVHQLIKATSVHLFVKKLDVTCDRSIGYEALKMIAEELTRSKLSSFRISVCVPAVTNQDSEGATKQRKACEAAGQAFVDTVKANMSLEALGLVDTKFSQTVLSEIEFYVNVNKFGRRLFLMDEEQVPLGLWGPVLSKHRKDISSLYFFLREQPMLIPSKAGAKRDGITFATTTTAAGKRKRAT